LQVTLSLISRILDLPGGHLVAGHRHFGRSFLIEALKQKADLFQR
jgi:hypothetical protein